MSKENEIMSFLHKNVFNPILDSKVASNTLKKGARYTIMRMNKLDANGMIHYFYSAICGTEKSIPFSEHVKQEGFKRFEDVHDEFKKLFC